ncbi:MAG: hypothetical protein ACXVCP_12670 [Bdellovibrio sp.]
MNFFGLVKHLLFSILFFSYLNTFAETREEIIKVEDLQKNKIIQNFAAIEVEIPWNGKTVNLNPLISINGNSDQNPLLNEKNVEVESVYVGYRTLNTDIPIEVFDNTEFESASVQNKLFPDVAFRGCSADHCKASQTTLLGPANYEVIYKYFKKNELSAIRIPMTFVNPKDQQSIKYALVQSAINWNDFFSSGFNIILIREDESHHAQMLAFQVFELPPHLTADKLYLMNISRTLDSQISSFYKALEKFKDALTKVTDHES